MRFNSDGILPGMSGVFSLCELSAAAFSKTFDLISSTDFSPTWQPIPLDAFSRPRRSP